MIASAVWNNGYDRPASFTIRGDESVHDHDHDDGHAVTGRAGGLDEPTPNRASYPRTGMVMNTDSRSLGRCPECGRIIPSGWTLIEYERANGETAVFAECPSCEAVVRPE